MKFLLGESGFGIKEAPVLSKQIKSALVIAVKKNNSNTSMQLHNYFFHIPAKVRIPLREHEETVINDLNITGRPSLLGAYLTYLVELSTQKFKTYFL